MGKSIAKFNIRIKASRKYKAPKYQYYKDMKEFLHNLPQNKLTV
jgi:hypothetical protein